MCYTKEVQLTTGATISLLSIFYYFLFSIKYQASQKKWLLPFLKNVIMACLLIGGHQIFEFLSLVTQSQIVYKIGLILSLSSMYFFIRSLEVILNKNLRSKVALYIIGIVAIHMFFIEMSFEPFSFYIKHNSAFIWASAFMLLFIYFHVCAIRGRRLLKDESSKKAIIFYLFATLDISFILSFIYTIWGYSHFSLNVCTDSPSIWCTFSVIQVLTLPLFLLAVPKILEVPETKTTQTLKETLLYFIISIAILALLVSILPFFNCLSLKFVFP